MNVLQSRNFVAGLAALGIGAFVVWVASDYSFGSARRMGPGFFPVSLGVLLALVGVAIMLGALREQEALPKIPLRPFLMLPGTILLFALMLPRLGYGPAGLAVVMLAGLSERYANPRTLLLVAIVLVPATWLLFAGALGVLIPLFAWNF